MSNILSSEANAFSVQSFLEPIRETMSSVLGFAVETWQSAVIAALALCLIVCLIIAIINPSKRRKKRLKRFFDNRKQAELISSRINQTDEEIKRFNDLVAEAELRAEEKKNALLESNKSQSEKDEIYNAVANEKIVKLSAKQRDLSQQLVKQQKGLFSGLKKGKARNTRLAINAIVEEQKLRSLEISKRSAEKAKRDVVLKSEINEINVELENQRAEYLAQISEKEIQRKSLLDELARINSQEIKLGSKDAAAILKEYEKNAEKEKKSRLQKAIENLEAAKDGYKAAQELRAKYEKEREDALQTIANEARERRRAARHESKNKIKYAAPEINLATEKETDEVNAALVAPSDETTVKKVEEQPQPFFDENAPIANGDDEVVITDLTYDEQVSRSSLDALESSIADEEEKAVAEKEREIASVAQKAEEDASNKQVPQDAQTQNSDALEEDVNASDAKEDDPSLDSQETTESDEAVFDGEKDAANVSDSKDERIEQANVERAAKRERRRDRKFARIVETENDFSISAEPIEQAAPSNGQIEPIPTDTVEETPNIPEQIPTVKKPFAYNDGIPATPIHKKSKFAKPITKIITKKRPIENEKPTETVAAPDVKKGAYSGKWKVETDAEGKFFAKLAASNGGVLLVTPSYSQNNGLKTAIVSIKKNLANGNCSVTANKDGKFNFKITTPSGRTIASSEVYNSKFQCEKALESTKRFAETAVIVSE